MKNSTSRKTGKNIKKAVKKTNKTKKRLPLKKIRRKSVASKKTKSLSARARSYKKKRMNKMKQTNKVMKGGFSNPLPDIDVAASLNHSFQNMFRGGMDVTSEHTFTDPSVTSHPRMEESAVGSAVVGDEPSTFFAN